MGIGTPMSQSRIDRPMMLSLRDNVSQQTESSEQSSYNPEPKARLVNEASARQRIELCFRMAGSARFKHIWYFASHPPRHHKLQREYSTVRTMSARDQKWESSFKGGPVPLATRKGGGQA